MLPLLLKDFYKVGHVFQYPKGTSLIYSNMTPRSTRRPGVDRVVVFGPQYFVMEYLITQFKREFFYKPRHVVVETYKRRVDLGLGTGTSVEHVEALHTLGYLPLHVKALPEGSLCPLRVPFLTLYNTHKDFYWLTNMVETLMSNVLWLPITSATTAFHYRKVFETYANWTGSTALGFTKWQGHDFSMRGMAGIEAAMLSGAAHLLSFTGTDTIPAIDFLERYYGANADGELIGGSVPATEHSVMSMGMQDGEFETFKRLVTEVYPKGIVSIVSDTWDLWRVCADYLPALRAEIMARDGKVVVRPDSGDPVKILCGDPDSPNPYVRAGVVELLWETFGGTVTQTGHRQLDPHIGVIYGDSITPERQRDILEKLYRKNFASTNVVLGIGSYTYQHVTRDTFGLAVKATYGEINGVGQNINKKPITDDGTKNSACGLLRVDQGRGGLIVTEQCTWAEEQAGELQTIFRDGRQQNFQTLKAVRARLESQL